MPRRAPPDRSDSGLPGLLRSRLGRALLGALVAAVALLATGVVVRQARAQAWRMEAYRLTAEGLAFVGLPASLGPPGIAALQDARRLPFDLSVFDPQAEDRIREVLARHPMVASVKSVDVRFPDRVRVRVGVRRPAAWFEVPDGRGGHGYHLVSADHRLLHPGPYAEHLERLPLPLPVVVGVADAPPTHAGQVWEDPREQVAEALAAVDVAARIYQELRGRVRVVKIDVERFPARPEWRDRGEVAFELQDGTIVEWGRTARAQALVAREDPFETKLWRLRRLLEKRGGRGGGTINVRYPLAGEAVRPGLR